MSRPCLNTNYYYESRKTFNWKLNSIAWLFSCVCRIQWKCLATRRGTAERHPIRHGVGGRIVSVVDDAIDAAEEKCESVGFHHGNTRCKLSLSFPLIFQPFLLNHPLRLALVCVCMCVLTMGTWRPLRRHLKNFKKSTGSRTSKEMGGKKNFHSRDHRRDELVIFTRNKRGWKRIRAITKKNYRQQ